jgi:hypothetical protein
MPKVAVVGPKLIFAFTTAQTLIQVRGFFGFAVCT